MSADRLVLGTAQLSQRYGVANIAEPLAHPDAVQLVRTAAASGIGGIDTAPAYGDAEAIIGEAAVTTPVLTKLDARAAGDVDASIRQSLDRLRRDELDVLFLHDPALVVDDPDDVIGRAASWIGSGVAALGASIYDHQQFDAALRDDRIGVLQAPVSLADGRLDDDLAAARHAGKPVYARSVFLQGALLLDAAGLPAPVRPLAPLVAAVDEVCVRRGLSRLDALVAYVRDLDGVTAVILGCETHAQLRENLAAIDAAGLPDEDLEQIRATRTDDLDVLDPRRWRS